MVFINKITRFIYLNSRPYWNFLKYSLNIRKESSSLVYPNLALKKYIYINPKRIKFSVSLAIKPKNSSKYFLSGDWDKNLITVDDVFQDNFKYRTAHEILFKKTPLNQTSEFRHVQEKIDNDGSYRGHVDANSYIKTIDKLYKSIKKNGYSKRKRLLNPWIGEIEVALGRNNELIKINSGNHRFACAYILSLRKIPVHVCAVHHSYYKIFEKGGFGALNTKLLEIQDMYEK
jgi:hypothetical protein